MLYQIVVLWCLCMLWRLWSKKHSTPEPPELSGRLLVLGHSLKFNKTNIMFNSIKRISEECLEKGGVITLYLGPIKVYGVADPEDCLTIMNTCLKKHYTFDFAKPFFGNGLTTADVPTWKIHRKLLNPAFSQQVLDGYIPIFNAKAKNFVDQFSTKMGKPFDHENVLRMNILETICSTLLGIDSCENSALLMDYLPRLPKLEEYVNRRLRRFWLHSDFIYNMTREKKNLDEEAKRFKVLSSTIIQKRKTEKKKQTNELNKEGGASFLDLILDLAEETGCFTDEEIQEHLDTVIAAGHDTSATHLTFVFTMLGSHADVQEKAYTEVLCVLGNSDKHVQKDDLCKLVYIEAVIKETLRLIPTFPILARRVEKDVKLKNYTLKANSNCYLLIHGLHRHSIWGPDADKFRPERWLEKETLPEGKYCGGFGMGKRACIGKAYSMMSMKIIVAHVLRAYAITSDVSKMVLKFQAMTKPVSGHFISLRQR